jgi:hypothetical protein
LSIGASGDDTDSLNGDYGVMTSSTDLVDAGAGSGTSKVKAHSHNWCREDLRS